MFKKLFFSVLLLALVCANASAVSFDRGLSLKETSVFMPRKSVFFGGFFSYHNLNSSSYQIAIVKDLGLKAYTLKATPFLYFTVADNQAVGVRFSYKRNMLDFGGTDLNLSDDLSFSLSEFYLLQHTYSASVAYRAYIPFKGSRIFALFADAGLEVGFGQSRNLSGSGDTATGTYVTSWEYGLNVSPGVSLFLTNVTALELSVGLLGVSYSTKDQVSNHVDNGKLSGLGGHLSIDYLSINIGITFALPY